MSSEVAPPDELAAAHRAGRLGWPVERLEKKALEIRRDIVTLLSKAQTGHSGGPLSCADFGTALFFNELNIDPRNPKWPERDYWHFSIGHVTPVIYSLMAERGYFPLKDLMKFRAFDGHAQGHPSTHDTPGIEVSAGSLGQGLSVCCGVAMAARIDHHPRRVYCVMGDGEQQEGQIWEAAMFAGHYKLDQLCAFIDYNRKQIDGDVEDILGIKPLADKWRAFNWNVIDCQGHDMRDILRAIAEARAHRGRPSVILAHTVMGQGVSYMADDYHWHGKPPKPDQAEAALKELGTSYAEWSARLLAN
ncbi:MAG TPA: transketolase [Candidatus Saccharimonadaceae bacterium]|nr:transketolase [Candidatus Saccharimonadaceae bacterium]